MTEMKEQDVFQSAHNAATRICTEPDLLLETLKDFAKEKFQNGESFASAFWPAFQQEVLENVRQALKEGRREFEFRGHMFTFVQEE
jgi:hypothetical protein